MHQTHKGYKSSTYKRHTQNNHPLKATKITCHWSNFYRFGIIIEDICTYNEQPGTRIHKLSIISAFKLCMWNQVWSFLHIDVTTQTKQMQKQQHANKKSLILGVIDIKCIFYIGIYYLSCIYFIEIFSLSRENMWEWWHQVIMPVF